MKKLRIAVIGCGRIAVVYQGILASLSDEIDVVLAMDKVPERAEAFAAHFPGCQSASDVTAKGFRAALQQTRPDLIHVLLPHHLHAEYAIAALEEGVHVLTEKPIAITLHDADRMMEAEAASGKQLGVIFQNRYIDGVQRVRHLIASGEMGAVKGAYSLLAWHRPPSYYECDWKGKWETEGGGVIIDQAIHSIDLVRYMTGLEVVKIQGHTGRRVLETIDVEDEADAALTLSNGAVYAFFACNYYTSNSPIRIEIDCENATALLTFEHMEINWKDGRREIIEATTANGTSGEGYWGKSHEKQIRAAYRALREGEKIPWRPQDAAKTLAIVNGIYESARTNSVVKLNG